MSHGISFSFLQIRRLFPQNRNYRQTFIWLWIPDSLFLQKLPQEKSSLIVHSFQRRHPLYDILT